MDLDQLKGEIPNIIIKKFIHESNSIEISYEEKDFEKFMLENEIKCESIKDIEDFISEIFNSL